jgi:hypothetical protein
VDTGTRFLGSLKYPGGMYYLLLSTCVFWRKCFGQSSWKSDWFVGEKVLSSVDFLDSEWVWRGFYLERIGRWGWMGGYLECRLEYGFWAGKDLDCKLFRKSEVI